MEKFVEYIEEEVKRLYEKLTAVLKTEHMAA